MSFPGHFAVSETSTRVSAFGRRLGGKRSCFGELHPQAKRSCGAGNQKGIQAPDSIKGLAGLEGVMMPSYPWSLLTAPRSEFRQILQRKEGPHPSPQPILGREGRWPRGQVIRKGKVTSPRGEGVKQGIQSQCKAKYWVL